jgi:hypothetical protein
MDYNNYMLRGPRQECLLQTVRYSSSRSLLGFSGEKYLLNCARDSTRNGIFRVFEHLIAVVAKA